MFIMKTPRTTSEAYQQSLIILKLYNQLIKNGGYSDEQNKFIANLLFSIPEKGLTLLKNILQYDNEFPKGKTFQDVWFVVPDKISEAMTQLNITGIQIPPEQSLEDYLKKVTSDEQTYGEWTKSIQQLDEASEIDGERISGLIKRKLLPAWRITLENLTVSWQQMLVDSSSAFGKATTLAHQDAYRIASGIKDRGEKINYEKIAEEVMQKYFKDLIPRETGKVAKNHHPELTKEWHDKRHSIRINLNHKINPKRKST